MPGSQKHRSGFVALLGRPNVGKSTLLNRLTGEKVAIVSPKPQTTRNRILGVVTREHGQIALMDTPGVHQPKGQLHRLMVETALQAIDEVDLVLFLVEPPGINKRVSSRLKIEIGEGNRFILEKLRTSGKPVILGVNKLDAIEKVLLLPMMDLYRREFEFAEIVPFSAKTGEGIDELFELCLKQMPLGPPLFDADMLTDQAEKVLVAEYIREQVLRFCREEIPYSSAVVVEFFDESEREPAKNKRPSKNGLAGLIRIDASIFVEREGQKAIVIGKQGAMLKNIGTHARKSIERLLGTHVFLSLRVRVEPRWSERADALRKMGYSQ